METVVLPLMFLVGVIVVVLVVVAIVVIVVVSTTIVVLEAVVAVSRTVQSTAVPGTEGYLTDITILWISA